MIFSSSPRAGHSGPIAAQISRDDEGWLHLDDVVTENENDEHWFREAWSNIGSDLIGDAGEGRMVFIVFGVMEWDKSYTEWGDEYDEYFVVEGEL